MVVIEKIF